MCLTAERDEQYERTTDVSGVGKTALSRITSQVSLTEQHAHSYKTVNMIEFTRHFCPKTLKSVASFFVRCVCGWSLIF